MFANKNYISKQTRKKSLLCRLNNFFKKILRYFIAKSYPPLKPLLSLFMKNREGVKAIINCGSKILLVKNSYGKGWTFPGGGVNQHEELEDAIIREVREEVRIDLTKVKNRGFVISQFPSGENKVTIFTSEVDSLDFEIDNLEVEKACWIETKKLSKIKLLPVAQKCAKLINLIN